MTDPRRWADDPDAPPAMRDLMRSARAPSAMSDAARARSSARLAQRTTAATSAHPLLALKPWMLALALGAALSAAFVATRRHPPATTRRATATAVASPHAMVAPPATREITAPAAVSSPIAPEVPPLVATPVATPRATTVATVASRAPHAARARAPSRTETATPEALPGEGALLLSAQRAMSRGAPSEALSALQRMDALYAHGSLVAERDALRVDVLHALGRDGEARTRAERFLREFPESPYRSRVARILDAR